MTDFSDSLCKLKLFGIKEGLECRMSEAASTNLSHQEFLQLLLEDEVLYRENRKFISLKNRAKFKDHVLLESFDTDPKREISKTMINNNGIKLINNSIQIPLFYFLIIIDTGPPPSGP